MNNYPFSEILDLWDIKLKSIHPNIIISGSPQRCNFRIVVEDTHCKKYILEKISENRYQHRLLISKILSYLSEQKINQINPYKKNNKNEFITKFNDSLWQLQPYFEGVLLVRPDYVYDKWRGGALADFLIQLWMKSSNISNNFDLPIFSIKEYVLNMIRTMRKHNPIELQKLNNVIQYLSSNFFKIYKSISIRFCHGDYHPLNIIWDKNSVKSVIDWEFMGIKIEIYDMANLLGCLGIEDPESLINGCSLEFIKKIKNAGSVSDIGLNYLFDCMITIRFAWLAEWFRNHDREMIELEIDFLNLLYEKKQIIQKQWSDL